jgi:hypothetical protein
MAGINDYSNTAGSNTTINGIDIAEGCSPAGINNAIRQLMADIADIDDGVVSLQTPDINGGTIDGAIIGGTTPAAGTFTSITTTGDINFGDNDKAVFGASNDLQIYHDGSNSLVEDIGTGDLRLKGTQVRIRSAGDESVADFLANSSVSLYYDNSKKLETTSTGIDVTGTVVSDGLTVDTDTLFVDSANNEVGVGTTSPDGKLHIDGSTNAVTGLVLSASSNVVDNRFIDFQNTSGLLRLGVEYDNTTAKLNITDRNRNKFFTFSEVDASIGVGTDSPDAKLHILPTTGTNTGLVIESAVNSTNQMIDFQNNNGDYRIGMQYDASVAQLHLTNRNRNKMFTVDELTGDISFYEDTGTTPKFFWDASAESLGIGTSSPSSMNAGANQLVVGNGSTGQGLTIYSSTTTAGSIHFADGTSGDTAYRGQLVYNHNGDYMAIYTSASQAMRITSDGSVGIGTSSPSAKLTVVESSIGDIIQGTGVNNTDFRIGNHALNNGGIYINSQYSNQDLRLQTQGSTRMTINSSGQVGIGTTSPSEKLEISGNAKASGYFWGTNVYANVGSTTSASFGNANGTGNGMYFPASTTVGFITNATERMRIDASGNVGIGTSSPSSVLHIKNTDPKVIIEDANNSTGGASYNPYIEFNALGDNVGSVGFSTNGNYFDIKAENYNSAPIRLFTGGSERMRIDSSGKIGIGTDSPQQLLHLKSNNPGGKIRLEMGQTGVANTDVTGEIQFYHNDASGAGVNADIKGICTSSIGAGALTFGTGTTSTTERMRIHSSGAVTIGKTTTSTSDAGFLMYSTGAIATTRASDVCIIANRLTNDGDIIQFNKDGTTVGSIGSNNGVRLGIGTSDTGIKFWEGDGILPANPSSTFTDRDNAIDLGHNSNRFKDAYITNGVTTGSDENEKQSIQSLTASEIAVAQRISQGFKTYKWNSAVEEKGDNARTHTGVIAQEVQQAFADEGLDASNYGMFMSNTWWEKEISVDAVAEELDEEGNIIVEGKDAYTYIDTKDEATEGYTERTRLGIRYPELLSFISSAFEQRLTNIETRLTALET